MNMFLFIPLSYLSDSHKTLYRHAQAFLLADSRTDVLFFNNAVHNSLNSPLSAGTKNSGSQSRCSSEAICNLINMSMGYVLEMKDLKIISAVPHNKKAI